MRAKVRPTELASVGAIFMAIVMVLIGISIVGGGNAFGGVFIVAAIGTAIYHFLNLKGADIPVAEEVVFNKPVAEATPSLETRLRRLDDLHKDGLLSYDEYTAQRRRILEAL